MIYTTASVSPAWSVNKADLLKWGHNLLVFLAPLGVMYLVQIYATLQKQALTIPDLFPSAATMGAIELYVVNGLLDLLRKFKDGTK